jgi:chaperone BCS1
MALKALLDAAFPTSYNGTNSTGPASLPSTILETFIPGFGPISNFLLHTFGFDVTIFVSVGVLVWLVAQVGGYLYHTGHQIVVQNYMASISVDRQVPSPALLVYWLTAAASTAFMIIS